MPCSNMQFHRRELLMRYAEDEVLCILRQIFVALPPLQKIETLLQQIIAYYLFDDWNELRLPLREPLSLPTEAFLPCSKFRAGFWCSGQISEIRQLLLRPPKQSIIRSATHHQLFRHSILPTDSIIRSSRSHSFNHGGQNCCGKPLAAVGSNVSHAVISYER